MHAHTHEVFRASLLVQADEIGGVKLLRLPVRDRILVTEFRRMPVGFAMIEILLRSLHVDIPRIPIAIFDGGLRAPVRPDSELGVAKPCGNFVCA